MSEIITPMSKEEEKFFTELSVSVKNENILDEEVLDNLSKNLEYQKSGEVKIKIFELIRDYRPLMFKSFLDELSNLMRA